MYIFEQFVDFPQNRKFREGNKGCDLFSNGMGLNYTLREVIKSNKNKGIALPQLCFELVVTDDKSLKSFHLALSYLGEVHL